MQLINMDKAKLMELAKKYQLYGRSRMKKHDLLDHFQKIVSISKNFIDGEAYNFEVYFTYEGYNEVDFKNELMKHTIYEEKDITELLNGEIFDPHISGYDLEIIINHDHDEDYFLSLRTLWGFEKPLADLTDIEHIKTYYEGCREVIKFFNENEEYVRKKGIFEFINFDKKRTKFNLI